MPAEVTPRTAAIIGLGLIGGSIGLALRRARPPWLVRGWDRSPAVLSRAGDLGAVDEGCGSGGEAVSGVDLVMVAVPVPATTATIRDVLAYLSEDAIVTDVAGTKMRIVAEAEEMLGGRFVGGHPMAGSERQGIGAARVDLFEGAPWLVTPTTSTSGRALATVQEAIADLGARAVLCSPSDHDRWAAVLSHLPHVLAFGMARTAAEMASDAAGLGAGGFRDGTRVARGDPASWSAILMDNRHQVLSATAQLRDWLGRVEAAIGVEDHDALAGLLAEGRDARLRME